MKKLVMAIASEGDDWFLEYESRSHERQRPASPDEITIDALCDVMDQDAENINAHAFAGVHRRLATLMTETLGLDPDMVRHVYIALAERQGLHGLDGYCGAGVQ